MNPQSDKNFLFALIAYQNGYITVEQFFEAATAWNKEPNKDIGEILTEKKFIEDVERYNIQGIVEDRIRRHGGLDNTLSFALENGSLPEGQLIPEDWTKQIERVVESKSTPSPPNLQNNGPNPGINRYIIRKTIGHGGQGYVWEAIDTELNRKVAIKNVHPNLSDDPIHQELLMDEARKTGKLGHPGVPPVFDIGKDNDGKPYFTMQLISGEKLSDRCANLKYEGISRREYVNQIRPVLRHLIAACNTVQYAFDNEDVIHRDLKPGNIMVNKYGETVVMDWGMGKVVNDPSDLKDDASSVLLIPMSQGSGSMGRTSVGTIKGSVMFMSPEQARAENDRLDHRTDVYGLGATLYWIITGRPPHKGTRASLPDIQKNLFPTPKQAVPGLSIPRELEAICLKAMATKPEDRYQKAGEMAADLENFIAGEPVSALPENLLRKSERFLRRHARAVVASLAALSLAVFGLTWANIIIRNQNKTIADQVLTLKERETALVLETKRTKDSRGIASGIIDSFAAVMVDNRLAQIPEANEVRLGLFETFAEQIETYLAKSPDDTELKLDQVRLLTRFAKLEQDQETEESVQSARSHWKRGEELLQEIKDTPDETFQFNWKKSFCDRAYYYLDLLLKDGATQQAEAMLREALSYADDIMKLPEERKGFAVHYARLYRRQSGIKETNQQWADALEFVQKAKRILEPMVEPYLTPAELQAPADSMIQEENLDVGTLGNFFLLCGDQADYETLLGKLNDAEQSALLALKACSLGPRVIDANRDGIRQTGTNYRRLQRIALMQKDFEKADKFYADWAAFFLENQGEPALKRHRFFILADRARGSAEKDLTKATESLQEAIKEYESIKNDSSSASLSLRSERSLAEMECSIAAARLVIAKANGQTDRLQDLSDEKQRCIERMKSLKASAYKIQELEFLP